MGDEAEPRRLPRRPSWCRGDSPCTPSWSCPCEDETRSKSSVRTRRHTTEATWIEPGTKTGTHMKMKKALGALGLVGVLLGLALLHREPAPPQHKQQQQTKPSQNPTRNNNSHHEKLVWLLAVHECQSSACVYIKKKTTGFNSSCPYTATNRHQTSLDYHKLKYEITMIGPHASIVSMINWYASNLHDVWWTLCTTILICISSKLVCTTVVSMINWYALLLLLLLNKSLLLLLRAIPTPGKKVYS